MDKINWRFVPIQFTWAAQNSDGSIYAYTAKPVLDRRNCNQWTVYWAGAEVVLLKKGKERSSSWSTSLTERPKTLNTIEKSMNIPHKHAASMLKYAEDAATTEQPWHLWELKSAGPGSVWLPLTGHPNWYTDTEYRRISEGDITITVSRQAAVNFLNWADSLGEVDREYNGLLPTIVSIFKEKVNGN